MVFETNSEGLFVPASYSAYVNSDSPVVVSNIFHEYYGHGLFCEHSQIGKQLTHVIQNGDDEKLFLCDEINAHKQPLGLCNINLCNYEGFAIWLEALLCKETSNNNIWNLKRERLPKHYDSLFEFFQNAEQKLSRFGFMSQLGFPKIYDDEKVLGMLKRFYDFENIDFIVLYGSRKPESDIDLFIVSKNNSTKFFNGWLDIYELNHKEFIRLLTNFDISVTDPLFTGRLIYGDRNCFEKLKMQISFQSITENAIKHNITEAINQETLLSSYSDSDKRKKDCLSYIYSYYKNAEQLSRGSKPLTLSNIQINHTK